MAELDIIALIEKNPVTKLSNTYNNKLVSKIKDNFTETQQQLFLSSFYCYLNYDAKNDFVVDLDNIWKWLGFNQKYNAKYCLEKNFTINNDYKIIAPEPSGAKKHMRGGHNKETIMLNVNTFKKFCLKAGTKKADEIHDYFLKLEEILQEVINEETNEIKLQLQQKTIEINNINEKTQNEKDELREKTILEQFPVNTQCIYYGKIDNKSIAKNESLIKFGQSNNLYERVKTHKKNFTNFKLVAAFKVKNKIEIENCIKRHKILEKRLRSVVIDDINCRELLAIDDNHFSLEKIDEYIREIIKENEYNIENYNLLLEKNNKLQNETMKLENELKEKNKLIESLNKKLEKYSCDITEETQKKIASNYTICKYGYFLYAFECENLRYKCSITRQKDFETLENNLLMLYPEGSMKYNLSVNYSFSEKIMHFLLKNTLTSMATNLYEGTFEDIKKILEISQNLEKLLVEKSKNLDELNDLFTNKNIFCENINPEVPVVRKSKRSIDQINKETGEIIKTYESIEAAGRSLGLTTGTAIGIALREKRVCQGFLWRYSGISKDDQYSEQPVVKICCNTGQKYYFKTIADAARDVNISAPALRQRILTDVHRDNYHWIFDKSSTHYKC